MVSDHNRSEYVIVFFTPPSFKINFILEKIIRKKSFLFKQIYTKESCSFVIIANASVNQKQA